MDKLTAEALEASIRHHKKNARAWFPWQVRLGPKYCALCQVYLKSHPGCNGCPVRARSRYPACFKTPYNSIHVALFEWREAGWWNRAARAEFRRAALAEVAFLESLREEE